MKNNVAKPLEREMSTFVTQNKETLATVQFIYRICYKLSSNLLLSQGDLKNSQSGNKTFLTTRQTLSKY